MVRKRVFNDLFMDRPPTITHRINNWQKPGSVREQAMAIKNWNAGFGLFSSSGNWSPDEAPAAGDKLYVPDGAAILYNETFGSADAASSIGLTSADASQPSRLIAWDATLANVTLDNAPATADPTPRHGAFVVAGTVLNDGGTIEAGRGNLLFPGNSLDIVLAPLSTLINTGTMGATPGNTMDITGSWGSALENNGRIVAAGGTVTVSSDLTGVGSVDVISGPPGFGGFLELEAGADAGQTVSLSRAALQIDQPARFLGQVALNTQNGGGRVTLEGLAAQSWDVSGSAVEFLDAAGVVVDTLRLLTPPDPAALTVYTVPDPTYGTAVALSVGPGFAPPSSATLLPYHDMAAAA